MEETVEARIHGATRVLVKEIGDKSVASRMYTLRCPSEWSLRFEWPGVSARGRARHCAGARSQIWSEISLSLLGKVTRMLPHGRNLRSSRSAGEGEGNFRGRRRKRMLGRDLDRIQGDRARDEDESTW